MLIVAVPSVATLLLILEKIRRLRLPRTYVVPAPDGTIEIYTDATTNDGRIVIVQSDESVVELPDQEISLSMLTDALKPPPTAHG